MVKGRGYTVKTKPRFGECYICFGCETKTGVVRILLIFKIGLCSATSLKRSWWELSIDVVEHRSRLNNYQNTPYPRFSLIPKTYTGIAFPKTGVCFYCISVWMSAPSGRFHGYRYGYPCRCRCWIIRSTDSSTMHLFIAVGLNTWSQGFCT